MLCAEALIVKRTGLKVEARIMYCRSWSCAICQPKRQKQLIAEGIQGNPNKFLTLTVNPARYSSPVERCQELIKAWRKLRLQIIDQLRLPLGARWRLVRGEIDPACFDAIRQDKKTRPKEQTPSVEFLGVIEAQESGEPHLHLLLRSEYVPQSWIAARMEAMIGAPICWIEALDGTKKIANYIAKYCGKDPHRFGTCKRYWQSKHYNLEPLTMIDEEPTADSYSTIAKISLEDWSQQQSKLGATLRVEGKWTIAEFDPLSRYALAGIKVEYSKRTDSS